MRKKIIQIFLVLLCGILFVPVFGIARSLPAFDWLNQYFETKYYSTRTDIRDVRIAGVDLWIPNNYKMGSYNTKDLDQRNALLQVLLPDLAPRTEENIEGFTKGLGWGERMQILLDDFSQTTDIQYRFKKRLEITGPFEPIKNIYGFDETFKSPFPDDPKVILGADFYVNKNENGIETYIACDIGKHVLDQGCQHDFVYDDKILVQISYSSRYLPDWKTIEEKTIDLIEKFKIKPLEGEPI